MAQEALSVKTAESEATTSDILERLRKAEAQAERERDERSTLEAVQEAIEQERVAAVQRAEQAEASAKESQERLQRLASDMHEAESGLLGKERTLRRQLADAQARLEEAKLTVEDTKRRLEDKLAAAQAESQEAQRLLAVQQGLNARRLEEALAAARATETERDTLHRRLESLRETLAAERASAASLATESATMSPAATHGAADASTVSTAGADTARRSDSPALVDDAARREREADKLVVRGLRDEQRSAAARAQAAIRKAEAAAEAALRRSEVAEANRQRVQAEVASLRAQLREALGQVEIGKQQIGQLSAMLMRRG
ncbi:hypothetical protein FNF29_05967 [Cafeteria roenbergensis]|nr:hypothetical protein FNF29_05967 [Cafeteria roenbergensis]|eukprot:KAA0149414.1 hypothetical protein FNF29_05967 [Cafeteria roenbergensis]